MKYIFFGTPEFAAIVLEKLVEAGIPPALVVCAPDKPAGRKKIITPPPTKILAEKYNIGVLQPETLANFKSQITNHKPDFFVVAAYAKILSREILAIPRLGTIGVHPSLLPKYRGVSPIQSAILNNEKETGTILFLMDEGVDHGPVLAQEKLPIANSNYEKLLKELAELSGDLLIKTIPKFVEGKVTPLPQNEAGATYTKKFGLEDALVDLKNDPPKQIWLKIRALNPEPGVATALELKNGKKIRLKLLEADFKDNKLELKRVQPESKNPMSYKNFLNGYKNLLAL